MTVVLDVVAGVLLLAGAALALGAGVGLVRFPDLLARMHTAAKPQVLGLLLMLTALALRVRGGSVVGMLLLVAAVQLVTAPVAAHMVARAGYRTGKVDSERLVVDELTRDLAMAAGIGMLEGELLDDDADELTGEGDVGEGRGDDDSSH
jgi:multicomponent Na+:H+ antiporter subunit G